MSYLSSGYRYNELYSTIQFIRLATISRSMIVIHSEVPIQPDSKEEASDILKEMAIKSRRESGVIDYRVTFDIEDTTVARIIEQYEDWSAVEAHESSSHLEWFQDAIEPLLSNDPQLFQYEVSDKTEAEGP